MSLESTSNINQSLSNEGPKLGFLETFFGVLFSPKQVFEDLHNEDTFTIIVYGALAVVLSSLGKLDPQSIGPLNIIGVEIIGILSWLFVGILIFFFSTVFKTPNNNLGRLLGFTGLSSIPFLLLTPVSLISVLLPLPGTGSIYMVCEVLISIWSFILFWIALAQSFKLEAWRVLLMAIIPFLLGIFLFTFLIANTLGILFGTVAP